MKLGDGRVVAADVPAGQAFVELLAGHLGPAMERGAIGHEVSGKESRENLPWSSVGQERARAVQWAYLSGVEREV
jgi:hypothetical protein